MKGQMVKMRREYSTHVKEDMRKMLKEIQGKCERKIW